ncbi:MAG: DUF2298 domain-containing protein, partial [Tepidiformaceae bacterium]
MGAVLAFWAVCLLTAALAFPIAAVILRRFPDAGAGLAFALGLLLLGYGYFTLRVLDILPPGRGGYLLAFALLAVVAASVAGRDRRLAATLRRAWPALLAMGGLFTLMFFAYVAFRSYQPAITGTEQPMDFMYLNATLESENYPPHDPWLAGERASYYYFGYLQVGLLTAASGVPASTGYNLGLAYTFAAAATGIASLTLALARWVLGPAGRRWALGAAGSAVFLLLGLGSLAAVFELGTAHGRYHRGLYETFGLEWMAPRGAEPALTCKSGRLLSGEWYPTDFCSWWEGSRIIPDTITEFPFFSFLLGDLHPHVMSIPLVLLALGLSASVWRGRSPLTAGTHRRAPFAGLLFAIALGALAFQNAWDLLTFSGVFVVVVAVRNARCLSPGRALLATGGYAAPVLLLGLAAYAPWYLDFRSQASGFHPYIGAGTRPAHAFLQFGPLLLAGLLALGWCARREGLARCFSVAPLTVWVPLAPLLLWATLAGWAGDFGAATSARCAGGWATLALYGIATGLLFTAFVALLLERRASA